MNSSIKTNLQPFCIKSKQLEFSIKVKTHWICRFAFFNLFTFSSSSFFFAVSHCCHWIVRRNRALFRLEWTHCHRSAGIVDRKNAYNLWCFVGSTMRWGTSSILCSRLSTLVLGATGVVVSKMKLCMWLKLEEEYDGECGV